MAISIDGLQVSDTELAPGATVGHAIDFAKTRLKGTGRLIFSVTCDGDEIDAARLRAVMAIPYARYRQIDFTTGSPYATVLEVLNQARTLFADSFATAKQVSVHLSAGDVAAAMGGLSECVGAWSNMHEAVLQGGGLVGVDFDRLVIGGRHVLDWLNDFNRQLRQIRDAIASRDHVALNDIMRYELDETLQNWETMLDGFIRHVEKLSAQEALANT